MQLLKQITPSEHGGAAIKVLQTGLQAGCAGDGRYERIIQSPVASEV